MWIGYDGRSGVLCDLYLAELRLYCFVLCFETVTLLKQSHFRTSFTISQLTALSFQLV